MKTKIIITHKSSHSYCEGFISKKLSTHKSGYILIDVKYLIGCEKFSSKFSKLVCHNKERLMKCIKLICKRNGYSIKLLNMYEFTESNEQKLMTFDQLVYHFGGYDCDEDGKRITPKKANFIRKVNKQGGTVRI